MTPVQVLLASLEQALSILAFFVAAWLIATQSQRLARWIVRIRKMAADKATWTEEHRQTLVGLISSMIKVFAFVLAVLATLRLFVEINTLIWVIGLFSAGFGIGARAIVADVLAGISFIFRNTFTIGDKVVLLIGANAIEGVIEAVNVSSTQVRAPTGELFTVPNGEISVVRNFMRSEFSGTRLRFEVPTADIRRTLDLLDALGKEAVDLLPNIREPWSTLVVDEHIGATTEITLIAKARFGQGAVLKRNMVCLIDERLRQASIAVHN